MKIASRSCNSPVRTDHSFDKDFNSSAISTNIRTYAHTTETVLFRPGPYLIQHTLLHRGCIFGYIPMHSPREGLESGYARTLHQKIRHTLTIGCGKCFYRRLHRGAACEDHLGIANADKKEDFRDRRVRHRITVSLLSAITFVERQEALADTS